MTSVPPPDPELPRAVALAWGVAANPQRGPKRELSIERIVEAAIEIADAEGLGAVSMSRVAASLGFTTMSLYRYVTSKDDLVLLMQEAASEVAVPDDALERGWRDGVTAWVLAIRGAYAAHPWLVDIPVSGAPITPNSLTIVDWFLREVRDLPLSDGEKMSTLLLLTAYSRATSAQERDLAAAAAAATANPAEVTGARHLATLSELVTPERFPHLQPLLAGGGYLADPSDAATEGDVDFRFGLRRILDGIEYHVARLAAAGPASDGAAAEGAGEGGHAEDAGDTGDETDAALPPELDLPREPGVREAARRRREAERSVREAERALREAQKREAEAVRRALERERHARAKAQRG